MENATCMTCGIPLVKRYLWAVGDWINAYQMGELIEERYLLQRPHVLLDTLPALKPNHPEEMPNGIKPYLKLFPLRLYIPQVYSYLPSPDPEMNLEIWLLEYGSLPLDAQGELQYPNLLPELSTLWAEASPLQQLIWLWQMARLWQPLQAKGVVSSLLQASLLRVNGLNVQLMELRLDEHRYHTIKELAEVWSPFLSHPQAAIADFCQGLKDNFGNGKIPHAESLITLLEKAIAELANHYQYRYQIVTATDTGPNREHNEDFCYPVPIPSPIPTPVPETALPEEEPAVTRPVSKLRGRNPIKISFPKDEPSTPEPPTPEPSNPEPLDPVPLTQDPLVEVSMVENSKPQELSVETVPTESEVEIPTLENLMIICDGVGGQDGGEIASQLTVNHLVQEIATRLPFSQKSSPTPSEQLPYQQVLQELEQGINQVNDRLNNRNNEEHRTDRERMGTTLVMTLAEHQSLYIANVGDSRCYWITENSCQQVTVDDDLACREVRLGYALYREVVQLPRSGALVQAMGMAASGSLYPALQRLLISDRSLFLLCSDGLSDFDRVEQYWQTELVPILTGEVDLLTGRDRLMALANEKNGHDNTTIGLLLCQVEAPETLPTLSYQAVEAQIPRGVTSNTLNAITAEAKILTPLPMMPSPPRRLPSVLYTPISLKAGIALIFVGTVSLLGLFGYSFFLWFTARSLEVAPQENVSSTPIPDSSIPATPVPTTPVQTTPIHATPIPATPIPDSSIPATPVPTTPIPTSPLPLSPSP
ncbi:MAG: protein phosphatase 2C domain-containing protein [Snowella sp.]|nr:protein phosphatase 2C domain-containing protein [Snowella sp.]